MGSAGTFIWLHAQYMWLRCVTYILVQTESSIGNPVWGIKAGYAAQPNSTNIFLEVKYHTFVTETAHWNGEPLGLKP